MQIQRCPCLNPNLHMQIKHILFCRRKKSPRFINLHIEINLKESIGFNAENIKISTHNYLAIK